MRRKFQDFVAWQVDQGTHGLVPTGTTGEAPTLSHDEQERVIALCAEVANGRVPVIAGTGSNSTAHTIELTRIAKEAGADAALIVCPYYNKPTQEGLYQHFKAIHDAVDLPIVIYNIPGRSCGRYDQRDDGSARETAQHRRRQGRDQRSRAAIAHAGRYRPRFFDDVGRGCDRSRLSRAGRRRLHLGHRQCGAAAAARKCTRRGSAASSRPSGKSTSG